jgi:hypothetical protein
MIPRLAVATLAAILAVCLPAADAFYLGVWKIDKALVAPWADPVPKQDTAEMKSLVGKTLAVKPHEITGPRQLACKGPLYKVRDDPADMLFQGEFGEMQRRDKRADPAKLAAQVGFRGSSWKTVETGCGNELDLHFIDPTTAAFGLNDYVYILKKQ